MTTILRLLGALHARGFHPAVLAALIIMPTVVAVGLLTDRLDRPGPGAAVQVSPLRGSLDDLALRGTLRAAHF